MAVPGHSEEYSVMDIFRFNIEVLTMAGWWRLRRKRPLTKIYLYYLWRKSPLDSLEILFIL
jgi:hypothetical protein